MTEQPIQPRERDEEQNPETSTPQPEPADPIRTPEEQADQWADALSGSDVGSDTRAGSLQGGSATGSERDEAQAASDRHLAALGPKLTRAPAGAEPPPGEPREGVNNTGHPREQKTAPGDDADTPTG